MSTSPSTASIWTVSSLDAAATESGVRQGIVLFVPSVTATIDMTDARG